MVDVQRIVRRSRTRLGRAKMRVIPRPWPPTLGPCQLPEPGDGEVTGPPDFVGIGAPRSGSTWFNRAVSSHPAIRFPSWGKELHFFDEFYDREFTDEDAARYQRYFPRRPGTLTGEFTPGYLYQPWARPMLRRAAPDAVIVVVLRDPLEQFTSSINYSAYHGAPRNGIMVSRHLGEAAYAAHLRPWLDDSGERLVVIQAERAFRDPQREAQRVWSRLGLDPVPVDTSRGRNAREITIRLTPTTRQMVVEYLEPDVRELAETFPHVDLSLWPNFSHLT